MLVFVRLGKVAVAEFTSNSATFCLGAVDDVGTKLLGLGSWNSLHVHTGLHVRVGNH